MKRAIERHSVATYFFITMILSGLLLPLHFIFQSVGNYSVSFTQFAPALAVVVLAVLMKDKVTIPRIIYSLRFHGDQIKWFGLAFLIPFICVAVSGVTLSFYSLEYVPWSGSGLFYILNIMAILLDCFAEELGWRGFLLPILQKKYTPIVSSLMVGTLWGIWHLNFTGGLLGFVLYSITIVETSILMTWLYNKTNGNLTTMVVYHFTFSLFSHLLLWERFTLQLFIIEVVVFGLACMVVILTNREMFFRNTGTVPVFP